MSQNTFPRWLRAALGLAALALLAGGAWFLRAQEQELRRDTEADLGAIARVKVDQIALWRAERLTDAAVIAENPFLIETVARWLAAPRAEDTDQILTHFGSLQQHYDYYDVLLIDAEGQVRLSLDGYVGPLHDQAAQALATALADRQPALSPLHAGPGDLPPHVDAVAPLLPPETGKPLGAILLQSDARQFLYPLIQSWPTPSDSAESLLVRREGDEVLFLNDLRFQPGAALTLRFPLSQAGLPAAMAVLGREGVVQGADYRGVEVLAALRAVPDSPWYLVAKVDAAEALAALRRETTLILALLLGVVFSAAVGVAALWQRNATAHYRALYRAEQRHRATLLSVGDGVIVTDAGGRVELFNPVAEALIGWSQAEARGKPLTEVFRIVNEETRRPMKDPAARVLQEERVVGLANHTLLVARDGAERPIADSGAPIRDEGGAISGVVLVFRDQTEERAAERALRESEEKYRLLAETTRDIILLHDMEGRLVYVNQAGLDFAGFELSEVLGRSITDFVPTPERAGLAARRARRAAGNGQVYRYEAEFEDRTGRRIPVKVHSTPIVREGQPVQILVVARDITERKRAEEALRDYSERLEERVEERTWELKEAQGRIAEALEFNQRIITASSLGITAYDASGDCVLANESAATIVGAMPEELLKQNFYHIGSWKKSNLLETAKEALASGSETRREVHLTSTFGDVIWIDCRFVPFSLSGEPHLLVLTDDVTEQRELRERLMRSERLAVLGQLAGSIGHELRNPLGVISNAAYFLKLVQPEAGDEVQEYLHILESEARNAARIVDDLLDFARIKSVDREAVSAEALAAAALARYPAPAGVDVTLDLPAALPPLHVDPRQMEQVLGNLLTNAYQAMSDGGRLTLSAARRGDEIALTVRDTGGGIPPEHLDKIFEPLFTSKARGIGLGLALCAQLTAANDGRIEVDSKPGKGSTFTLFLPKAKDG